MRFIALLVLFHIQLQAETLRVYQIGNSLTWDSQPHYLPTALQSGGVTPVVGRHIACGRSLTAIYVEPDYICVPSIEPYGTWLNALTNYEWDAITIQSYGDNNYHHGVEELASLIEIIAIATSDGRNQDCVFYIYAVWPTISTTESYRELWERPYDNPAARSIHCRAYFQYLYDNIRLAYPDLEFRMIPTGEIFAVIDDKLKEHSVSGFDSTYSLYRDSLHMSTLSGQYVAHGAMSASLLGMAPDTLTFHPEFADPIDDDFAAFADEIVESVLIQEGLLARKPAAISYKQLDGMVELQYDGILQYSPDLLNWDDIDTYSPFRVIEHETPSFYRARN